MSRVITESYELGTQTLRARTSGGSISTTATFDLNGNYCLALANGGITYTNTGSDSDLYVSFFIRFVTIAAAGGSSVTAGLLTFYSASAAPLGSLRLNGVTGHLELYTGAIAVLVATGTYTFTTATTYHIQVRNKVANAGGVFEVKVNDVVDATFTGDTQPASETFAEYIDFRSESSGHSWRQDDVMMNNSLGSSETTYTGINRIAAGLVPTGPGFYVNNWSRNTGSANWECVDEIPNDGDTTYIFTSSPNIYESFSMSDQSLSNVSYKALMTSAVARKDSGTVQLAVGFRDVLNTTNYYGANGALGVSYGVITARNTVDPSTGLAWTSGRLNSVESLVVSTAG